MDSNTGTVNSLTKAIKRSFGSRMEKLEDFEESVDPNESKVDSKNSSETVCSNNPPDWLFLDSQQRDNTHQDILQEVAYITQQCLTPQIGNDTGHDAPGDNCPWQSKESGSYFSRETSLFRNSSDSETIEFPDDYSSWNQGHECNSNTSSKVVRESVDGQSPTTVSEDSSARLRTSDVPMLDFSDIKHHLAKETRRSKRCKEWKEHCPICNKTLRLQELQSHYDSELEKLKSIRRISKKRSLEKDDAKQSFNQIKNNRENRLTARASRFYERVKNMIRCPVCSLHISGCAEDINKHVSLCYQNEDLFDEDVVVDGNVEEEFEEFEIGSETRVRTISLVPGGHRALEGTHIQSRNSEEDVDIVDIDDTISYGEPQYSELDVIMNNSDENDETREQLRKAVIMDPTAERQVLVSRKWSRSSESETIESSESKRSDMDSPVSANGVLLGKNSGPKNMFVADQIVSSLKERIKDLEDMNKSVKCLICMEPYTNPVVSTICWHVYCEECWLMTMGMKKLCPQCNMIVFPTDLRKIYL